jgi:hypothetical protein
MSGPGAVSTGNAGERCHSLFQIAAIAPAHVCRRRGAREQIDGRAEVSL